MHACRPTSTPPDGSGADTEQQHVEEALVTAGRAEARGAHKAEGRSTMQEALLAQPTARPQPEPLSHAPSSLATGNFRLLEMTKPVGQRTQRRRHHILETCTTITTEQPPSPPQSATVRLKIPRCRFLLRAWDLYGEAGGTRACINE